MSPKKDFNRMSIKEALKSIRPDENFDAAAEVDAADTYADEYTKDDEYTEEE